MDKTKLIENADKLLGYVLDGVEKSAEFAKEQAPILVQEVIRWGIIEHAIYAAICLGVVLLGLWFGKVNHRNSSGEVWVVAFPVMALGAGLGVFNLVIAAKAAFAPRLYLLEVLKGLLGRS